MALSICHGVAQMYRDMIARYVRLVKRRNVKIVLFCWLYFNIFLCYTLVLYNMWDTSTVSICGLVGLKSNKHI